MTQVKEPAVEYVAWLTFGGVNPPPMEDLGAYDDADEAKAACAHRMAELDAAARGRNALAWMPTSGGFEAHALPDCVCSVKRREKREPEMIEIGRDD